MLPSRRPGGPPTPVGGKEGREDGLPAWIKAPNSMNLGLGGVYRADFSIHPDGAWSNGRVRPVAPV